jgi:hypothetical protein
LNEQKTGKPYVGLFAGLPDRNDLKMTFLETTRDKSIALVAHDSQKTNLLAWAKYNRHVAYTREVPNYDSYRQRELMAPVLGIRCFDG